MKISRKYSSLVSGFFISVSMSLSISFIMTLIKSTPLPIDEFIKIWLKSSAQGFAVGFPLARFYVPKILNNVEKRTEDEEIPRCSKECIYYRDDK